MSFWRRTQKARLTVGASTDVGKVRTENQDTFAFFGFPVTPDSHGLLCVVADGMGGHSGGQEASRIAVEALRDAFSEPVPHHHIAEALGVAIRQANTRVYQRGNGTYDHMGTTCTALAIADDRVFLGHVGDSRAYRISSAGIEQITHDHTFARELFRQGAITAEEAERHPRRNMLTRALGVEPVIEIDLSYSAELIPGERYVLCSDGLLLVDPGEIRNIATELKPQAAADRLVALANERGGSDNITAMIVEAGA